MSRSNNRLRLRRMKHPNARIPTVTDLRCPSGKFNYSTRDEARAAQQHLATLDRLTQPYRCPMCRRWHLTHARQAQSEPSL